MKPGLMRLVLMDEAGRPIWSCDMARRDDEAREKDADESGQTLKRAVREYARMAAKTDDDDLRAMVDFVWEIVRHT